MKLDTYVNFRGNCLEALQHYEKRLGAKAGMIMTHAQAPNQRISPEWRNAVLHARISISGHERMAADIPNAELMRSDYLTLRMDSDVEGEHVFAGLCDGGRVLMPIQDTFFASRFGQVQDRFGINLDDSQQTAGAAAATESSRSR